VIRRLREWWRSPESSVHVHRVLKWVWIGMVPVAILTSLKYSVPFLVGASIYANIVGHWSAEQAGIVERKQDEIERSKK
jgi:hypothetical protein